MSNYAYYSEIEKVEFYVLGSDENIMDSKVTINNKELFKGESPVPEGVYDAHMGTTSYDWRCETCGNKKGTCSGHFGSIDLKYPVKSPLFRDTILKWLKIICFKCGRLIVNKTLKTNKTKLLSEYVKLIRDIKVCPWSDCKEPHPKIVKDKILQAKFYMETQVGDRIERKELYNHIIKDILERITDETVLSIGKPLESHPKKFILDTIRVAPNTIRPDIRKIGGNRSNNSDITALTKNIVEINEVLPLVIPQPSEMTKDLQEMYFNLDMTYYELVKGSTNTNNQVRLVASNNKTPNSIANRIPKKTGRIRRNIMGKRTGMMGRSVITGDDTLRVDEIGFPIAMARALQIPEYVRSYNKDRLNIYFMNKRNVYPGCSEIFVNATQSWHNIEYYSANFPNYELQDGDIIMRDIIDGDVVGFNRQPSLLFGQIGSHRVKVMEKVGTLSLNVSACAPYNADFDGDKQVSPTGECPYSWLLKL